MKFTRFFSAVCRNDEFCTYQLLVEFLMMKHKDMKTFTDKMKNEESALTKGRVALQPDNSEISSMYDKIYTNLQPESVSFDLPQFTERIEGLYRGAIEDGNNVKEKSNALHHSYLKF